MPRIQEVRFLAKYQGTLRKICKLTFPTGDHSIYVVPYAAGGEYVYGQHTFPNQETHDSFNFVEGAVRATIEPHLSLHESGQVQVYSRGFAKAGPLHIPNLTTLRGGHIATVTPDRFESLPVLEGDLRTGARRDHVIEAEEGVASGRLAFFINGQARIFPGIEPDVVIRQRRPTYKGTVYIGVKILTQLPIGGDGPRGTTVIAGWHPDLPPDQITDYLYIRGR